MNSQQFSKAQKREVRRVAGLAHERELAAAAGVLQQEFERWRRGEIDVFSLNDRIHKFHDGISRDLYKQYVLGPAEWNVASAIARGIVRETEVDAQVLELLGSSIESVRQKEQETKDA